jgi:hypothetical protein
MKDQADQGIVRAGRGEEQPADKDRAQRIAKTELGHMPLQPLDEIRSHGKKDHAGRDQVVTRAIASAVQVTGKR